MTGHIEHATLGPTVKLQTVIPIELDLLLESTAKANGLTRNQFIVQTLADEVGYKLDK